MGAIAGRCGDGREHLFGKSTTCLQIAAILAVIRVCTTSRCGSRRCLYVAVAVTVVSGPTTSSGCAGA